jgi:hypothetical protein
VHLEREQPLALVDEAETAEAAEVLEHQVALEASVA